MDKPDAYQKGWVEFYKQSLKNSTENLPKAYAEGYVEFYKLRFKVTPDVLIPRPETELLVDEVLNILRDEQGESKSSHIRSNNNKPITILDLGTGSGNIAISLAKNIKKYLTSGVGVKIIATDVSEKALKIAKQNAKLHRVENQIIFFKSNLLSNISLHNTLPDIIVTNLPYIPTQRISYLDSSVKDFEPHVALDGGKDGFELYRKLFKQIVKLSLTPRRCKPKLIIGEIDYTHGELAVIEAQKYFPQAEIKAKKDLTHLQRILIIKI